MEDIQGERKREREREREKEGEREKGRGFRLMKSKRPSLPLNTTGRSQETKI